MITGLGHVQVAMPPGGEDQARDYYGGVLGMIELPKPPALVARGGCWFLSGTALLHLGVEEPFAPALKAHPCFIVEDLDAVESELVREGYACAPDDGVPGVRRFHTHDPFGNRLEFEQTT